MCLITGGEIQSIFDNPENCKLGYCDLIEEVIIGGCKFLKFSDTCVKKGEACTIVLRGATQQILDEAERSIHDAIPTIIVDNGGYDSAHVVSELRAVHTEGKHKYGINMDLGELADMESLGITESFRVKRQVLLSAAEAAEMILHVDDIMNYAPRARPHDMRDH